MMTSRTEIHYWRNRTTIVGRAMDYMPGKSYAEIFAACCRNNNLTLAANLMLYIDSLDTPHNRNLICSTLDRICRDGNDKEIMMYSNFYREKLDR